MADGGYLQPPAQGEKPFQMWEMTWKRIDRFLPNLFRDIYPESKPTQLEPSEAASQQQPEGAAGSLDSDRGRPRETEPKGEKEEES